jgi:hypothetical protein
MGYMPYTTKKYAQYFFAITYVWQRYNMRLWTYRCNANRQISSNLIKYDIPWDLIIYTAKWYVISTLWLKTETSNSMGERVTSRKA